MTSAGYNPYGQPTAPQGMFPPHHPFAPGQPPKRRGLPVWAWLLIIIGLVIVLGCGGFLGFAMYLGAVGPSPDGYAGHEVPKKFMDVVTELKLLEPGESIRFFYSDAITDVREGMYFVTDRNVVIYIGGAATPATVVPFERIADAELETDKSVFEDGSVTLQLKDGSAVVFPVPGESKRDKLMFDAIRVTPARQSARDVDVER